MSRILGVSLLLPLLLTGCAQQKTATAKTTSPVTMRLKVKPGQVYDYVLTVERLDKNEKGEISERAEVTKIDPDGTIYMDASVSGLKINGVDKSEDLQKILGNQKATIPWNDMSQRTGFLKPLKFQPGDKKVMAYLGECGIYLAYFKKEPVKVGDSWNGVTTATGGCTSAKFTLTDLKANLAYLDVTDISMIDFKQVGPMKMIVNLDHGMTELVEYTAKHNETGNRLKFTQVLKAKQS